MLCQIEKIAIKKKIFSSFSKSIESFPETNLAITFGVKQENDQIAIKKWICLRFTATATFLVKVPFGKDIGVVAVNWQTWENSFRRFAANR